jgi:hypothetical protein
MSDALNLGDFDSSGAKGTVIAVFRRGSKHSRVLFRRAEDGKLFSVLVKNAGVPADSVPADAAPVRVSEDFLEELTGLQKKKADGWLAAASAPTAFDEARARGPGRLFPSEG